MSLRIGINALFLLPGGVGGTEIYLRNLLAALERVDGSSKYFVFTNLETDAGLVPGCFERVPQNVRAQNRPARILWEQLRLPAEIRRLKLDVLLNPGFTSPAAVACPMVTVFHDLQHKRHPEHFRWFDLPFWNVFLRLSASRSALLLADSEATRSDLLRYYSVPPSRVRVALLGVEDAFFELEREPETDRPYLLCVSTLHPHKNHERLLRAFLRVRERHPKLRLLMTGVRGFHANVIEKRISELGLQPAVEFTGWVERSRLYDLYRRAAACVYPSTFEGFGLPVLEAMAAGAPLACSAIEPLQSLAGPTAFLFPPEDEDAMTEALHRALGAPAVDNEAREHARKYSWDATAKTVLQALEDVSGAAIRAES